MAFLDDVKKFGKNITDKGKDVIEITKLNSQIGAEKDKIKDLYLKIGEAVYKAYSAGEGSAYDELCGQIKEIDAKVVELNAKVLELKNATKCPNCGAEVTKETAFCSKCGAKVNG
ncbi:MAG: zinc ribbon domain-containing protein [Clostridia bacterium]|nr:zinc ribbon domain-containing protein [Clostridia bacterium]